VSDWVEPAPSVTDARRITSGINGRAYYLNPYGGVFYIDGSSVAGVGTHPFEYPQHVPDDGSGWDLGVGADGVPWVSRIPDAVSTSGGMSKYNNANGKWNWRMPGWAAAISVGGGKPWVVGGVHTNGKWNIWRYRDGAGFDPMLGTGFDIAVSPVCVPSHIGENGQVWHWDPTASRWTPDPDHGHGSRIAAGPNGMLAVTNSANQIWVKGF
jgi:hypothetical protein